MRRTAEKNAYPVCFSSNDRACAWLLFPLGLGNVQAMHAPCTPHAQAGSSPPATIPPTVNLHAQRATNAQRVLRVRPPHGQRQIAARAGRQRTQQIDLGKKLQVIALLRRTRFHEVHVVVVEAGALENIQHVMHVELGQAMGQHGAGQVGVAVVVKVFAGEHFVHIGIAAGAEQIVQATAMFIDAVARQAVIGDGHQRPQETAGSTRAGHGC